MRDDVVLGPFAFFLHGGMNVVLQLDVLFYGVQFLLEGQSAREGPHPGF